jgi:hypothetical protein
MASAVAAPGQERTVPMGRQEALPIRPLPQAWDPIHFLGPGMVLTALGVGFGETYMWPRLVIVFGPNIRILFFIGMLIQLFVMLEMARWAMATGESIFFGAARLHPSVMWFFWLSAMFIYIWPGHIVLGAQSLETLTGNALPWAWTATAGMILIAVVLTFAPVAYSAVETVLTVLISVLVLGSIVVAAMVGNLKDVGDTILGLVGLSYWTGNPLDPRTGVFSATWLPIVVGSIAFAGPSGMQQMWYTLYLRDKGAGMGRYGGRITSWLTGEEESMPARGHTFDTNDPAELHKWRGWKRWNAFDAVVLFWGVTTLTTLIFTVLALASTQINPQAREAIVSGTRGAALDAMATAFGQAGGQVLRSAFFLFMAVVGWKMSFGIFDAFSRGQADMTWYFWPGARRIHMSKLYYGFLYFVVVFGIGVLWINQANPPTFILDMLAFMSAFAMGAYALLLLATNNLLLPKEIRPGIVSNAIMALGAVFYLGGLFYSLIFLGKIPSG